MRLGQSVWHSARISEENAEIDTFATPKEIHTRPNYFSVMPATSRGFMEVMSYGEDVDNTWTAIANDRAFHGKIKEGDLFWIDGDKPPMPSELSDEFGYAESATAVVKSVSYVNMSIAITLTRNKDRVKQ
jgi:hypothetical protein